MSSGTGMHLPSTLSEMDTGGKMAREKAVCNRCGATYEDKESIELIKKWLRNGQAPCPNLSCPGRMEIKKG